MAKATATPAPKRTPDPSEAPQKAATGAASTALAPLNAGGAMASYDQAFAEQMRSAAKETAAQERPTTSKLSIKGGILAYEGEPVANNEMEVVVLSSAFINTFYIDRYNPNKLVAPRCFSIALDDDAMTPHENVLEPAPSDACETCPNSEWGSDPGGGRGKACKQKRRIVLMPASALGEVNKAELAVIDLPVMSVKNWANYINKLAAATGLPYYAVVTKLKVIPDARSQYVVTFDGVGAIQSKETIQAVQVRREEAEQLSLMPFETYKVEEEAPKSSGKTKY